MATTFLSALNPTLLPGVRDHLAQTFATKIGEVIPEISEFIEFEAEACSGRAEKRCFEQAAVALLAQRAQVQNTIKREFTDRFDARLNPVADNKNKTGRFKLDTLSLVPDDQMNAEIAVNHCASRLKEQSEYELYALTRRLEILLGREHIDDEDNPVSTRMVARVLMLAIESLASDAAVKLATFKAFGPILLDLVPELYAVGSEFLTNGGIDIDMDDRYGQPIIRPASRSFSDLPQPVFAVLTAPESEAISLLKKMLIPGATENKGDNAVSGPLPGNLHDRRALLAAVQQHVSSGTNTPSGDGRALHQTRQQLRDKMDFDGAVIADLVTVMFDRLASDTRIANALKPSVQRLQLPVLEVALQDHSLFSDSTHPVLGFIDLIAEFGMTMGMHEHAAPIAQSVAKIVDDLVADRTNRVAAFKLAFRKIDDLFYHHEEAALQCDEEVLGLHRSEAQDQARKMANHEISTKLRDRPVPPSVITFIKNAWRDVLVRDYLDGGRKGLSWKLGTATLDELLKSVEPGMTPDDRSNRARMLPSLIELLREGIQRANVSMGPFENFFTDLQLVHENAVRGMHSAGIEAARSLNDNGSTSDQPDSSISPSTVLAEMGLCGGEWLELREGGQTQRWRLAWMTPIKGTCVLKHYESRATRTMELAELKKRVTNGSAIIVKGAGLTASVIDEAFTVIARKARREIVKAPPNEAALTYPASLISALAQDRTRAP